MTKKMWVMAAAVLIGMTVSGVEAARPRGGYGSGECSYTPLQDLVRLARDSEEIKKLMEQGVQMDDPSIKCGGNLLQLAIRRGNPAVVDLILQQAPKRAKESISIQGFNIPDAPTNVTMAMFAGFYAPSEQIFQLVVNAGADIQEVDANGNTVLWYMERNPVLVDTKTYDDVRQAILMGYSQGEEKNAALSDGKKEEKK